MSYGGCKSVTFLFKSYQNNLTPLFVASERGHLAVVQTLLGAGADINIATINDDVSNVPILYHFIYRFVLHVHTFTCIICMYCCTCTCMCLYDRIHCKTFQIMQNFENQEIWRYFGHAQTYISYLMRY